ncbi:MAG TPA: PDZ domain-containing protein [Anaerolineae bacterium]|jgi:S1-C subfamily serine protease
MKKRILLIAGAALGAALVFGATLYAGVNVVQAATRVGRDLITGRTANLVQDALQATTDVKGIVVVLVATDSPADKAGVKRGDILLKVDSTEVNSTRDLQTYLATKKAGDSVALSITHGDTAKTLNATLVDQNGRVYLGVAGFGGNMFGKGAGFGHGMFGKGMPGFGVPITGTHVLVTEVITDSPASGAGIKVGDIIFSVDGKTFGANESLSDIVSSHKVGDSIKLSVQHQGDANPTDVTVKLTDNPNKAGTPYLGVQYRMGGRFENGMRQNGGPGFGFGRGRGNPGLQPGTPYTQTNPGGTFQMPQRIPGAMVFQVTDGSPAAKAGLVRSDVITAINGKTVDSAQALVDAIATYKPNDNVTLTVQHRMDTTTVEVKVTLGDNPSKAGSAYLGVSLGDALSMPQFRMNPGNRNPNNNQQPAQTSGNTL